MASGSAYLRGVAALKANNFNEARRFFKEASAHDDARGTYMLARMVARGDGGPEDPQSALTLFRLAAESGFTPAITAVANALWFARDPGRDRAEGWRLFRIAARRGHEPALAHLALVHTEGTHDPFVSPDRKVAQVLAERSVNTLLGKAVLGTLLRDGSESARGFALLQETAASSAYAQYQLGVAYEHGLGTAPDRAKAIEEYEKAATRGVEYARTRLRALTGE